MSRSRSGAWPDAVRLAVGTLTIIPVRPPRRLDHAVASRAMSLAPLVGLGLGLLAATLVVVGRHWWSPLLTATLAVALLALASRGLHLDGLADTADGLGSGRRVAEALELMRRGDIGPFGVVTLVLVLILQIVATSQAPWWALVVAVPVGRLGMTFACSRGVPAARPDGLGASVAGSVPRPVCVALGLALLLFAAPFDGRQSIVAVGCGLVTAVGVAAYAVRRLGGVTGDVLGAVSEVSTTTTLLVLAVH